MTPSTVDRSYHTLARIGEGALCEVHLAREEATGGSLVALKVLKDKVASAHTRELFEADVRALRLLDHPHVAKVLDSGTTEAGLPYCAMEYVPGLALTSFCDMERLGLRARIELFLQICEAVEHANRRGVVHRDLKPENVLVTWHRGRPFAKLIDFNLSRLPGAASDAVVGTPAYMSPEQADPSVRPVDSRSDVYSLGVLLYQLLADSLPFATDELLHEGFDGMRRTLWERIPTAPSERVWSETAKTTRKGHATGIGSLGNRLASSGARLLRQLRGLRLRGDLDAIVLHALEKRPEARYPSAQALRDDLQRYLERRPVAVRAGEGRAYRLRRQLARGRVALPAAAALILALLAPLFGLAGGATTLQKPSLDDGDLQARLASGDAVVHLELSACDELALPADEHRAVAYMLETGDVQVCIGRLSASGEPGTLRLLPIEPLEFTAKELSVRSSQGRVSPVLGSS